MKRELRVIRDHGRQYIGDLRKQTVSERFRGLPVISERITPQEIESVSALCPVNAIDSKCGAIDLGRCAFCNECALMLPERIRFLNDHRIAANRREDLIISPGRLEPLRLDQSAIRKDVRRLFKKALKLRQVSAGGDNSCEMELAATGNVNFDFGRYGVEFVASPRHADGIVITGPITENMSRALELTYEAVPSPKIIILVGAEAISGGIFDGSPALNRSFLTNHKTDLYVPGNPAHPLTFINGVMDLLGL